VSICSTRLPTTHTTARDPQTLALAKRAKTAEEEEEEEETLRVLLDGPTQPPRLMTQRAPPLRASNVSH